MALRNGLLIHGPTSWAVAARDRDGEIEVASGPKPSFTPGGLGSTPLLRGPLRLAEALAIVPLARLRLASARLPFEDRTVVIAVVASAIGSRLLRRLSPATVGREAAIALLGALPAFTALRDSDLAAYHGVEHKSIGGYETGTDPAAVPKEHERCGSNLIAPMLALSVAGQVAGRAPRRQARPRRARDRRAGSGRRRGRALRLRRAPSRFRARAGDPRAGLRDPAPFSTREPTADQLEVGVAALNEILTAGTRSCRYRLEHADLARRPARPPTSPGTSYTISTRPDDRCSWGDRLLPVAHVQAPAADQATGDLRRSRRRR